MNQHIVKVLEANYITHDVKRFVVQKPRGYSFIPGQATDVSVNLTEWQNELRPFTFTSLNEWHHLEFMIKIYSDRKGVTDMLGRVNPGEELIIHDVFGAIHYKGPGVFIAGGAGITPFISIFRALYKSKELENNMLIYSNKTSSDVIMEEELTKMLMNNFVKIFTRENVAGFFGRRIDKDYLAEKISDYGVHFYLCGPDEFVKVISQILITLGATAEAVVFEE